VRRSVRVAAPLAGLALLVTGAARSPGAFAAEASCRFAIATVSTAWSGGEAAKGVVVRVSYPSSVEVPVPDGSPSPAARVENRTGVSGGLFDSVRRDADGDGHGDLVNVGLIASEIEPGEFARVRFDCSPGAAPPRAGDFSCTSEVAGAGGAIASSCAVALALE
jgi:hypothetical protein